MKLLFFFLGFDRVFVFRISVLSWLEFTINTKESIDLVNSVSTLPTLLECSEN